MEPSVPIDRCQPYADMVSALAENYREGPIREGVVSSAQYVMTLFASAETGTWTVVLTDVHGMACAVIAGVGMALGGPSL